MTLKPIGPGRCDRLQLDVTKLASDDQLALFDPGPSTFRVVVGGCQTGAYLAEVHNPDGEQPERLSFVIDLADVVEQGPQRLCVVRIEPGMCLEHQAWWSSGLVEVSQMGCLGQDDDNALPLTPPPVESREPAYSCLEDQCPTSGNVFERTSSDGHRRVLTCRPAGDGETTDDPVLEHIMDLDSIPGGMLVGEDGLGPAEVAPFWMSRKELQARLYWLLYGNERPFRAAQRCMDAQDSPESGQCPVADISWWSALEFANRLSRMAGLEECYDLRACPPAPAGELVCDGPVAVNAPGGDPRLCVGYRLPTETEWVHAALGGLAHADQPPIDEVANYCPTREDCGTWPACELDANAFDLCDTLGNVWEWVWDQPGPGVPEHRSCAASSGHHTKGGGFASPPESVNAFGGGCYPQVQGGKAFANDVGFRLARSLLSQGP